MDQSHRQEKPRQSPDERESRGLWRHRAFLYLWAAQSLLMLGSQITVLAIPLLAVITLDASAFEVGLLALASSLPAPVVGLLAGVWTDRVRRRPILIGADTGRAVLLGTIPLAALFDMLDVPYLCAVVLLTGLLGTWFDVAHASLLPSLIRQDQLVEGNSKLEASRSGALIAGPGVAGILIQAVTAPVAILIDACSYVVSALLLLRIRVTESLPDRTGPRRPVWEEAREGLGAVRHNRMLASMALSLSVFNLFSTMLNSLFVLFAVRDLGLDPSTLGLIFALGSAGFPVGAAAAGWIARGIGMGPAIIWGAVISDLALLLVPLAGVRHELTVPLLIASRVIATLSGPVTAINQLSLRQLVTPDHLLGRVNATMLVLALSLAPLGALIAGSLGEIIGLQATVTIAAVGVQFGFIILLISPLHSVTSSWCPPTLDVA